MLARRRLLAAPAAGLKPGLARAARLVAPTVDRHRESQVRRLHLSAPARARQSFARRLQDRFNRIKNDPEARNKLVGVGATGYAITKMAKFGAFAKYALPALKLTKAMPLMSMGLTTVCYSCFFGVPFAVGIVGTLFSSNWARAAALKKAGCEVTTQHMVPFFGVIGGGATDYTKSEEFVLAGRPFDRCLVTLAPVAGMLAFTTAVPFALGVGMGSQCGLAVANTGYMMGMFSLLPMGDMTPGGQLLNFFSKNALLLGTGFNLCLLFVLSNPILYLCLALNLYRLYTRGFTLFGRQFGGGDQSSQETLRSITLSNFTDQQKSIVLGLYWACFLLNAGGMYVVGTSLKSPQQLRAQQQQEDMAQRLQEQAQPGNYPEYLKPRRPIPEPDSVGGWGIADWAMGNLEAVERLDRDDGEMAWWEEAQRQAAREAAAEMHRSQQYRHQ